uniref:Nitrogen permease regulator 2-like protein n=1 Tax=Hirondellea gigas TaxID=1518452 RepID=A0A2P2I0T8_9CRUS
MDVQQTPGPIDGLFFAQFHPKFGPQIQYKYPPDCISCDLFDKLTNFIIPKPDVLRQVVTITSLGVKVKGYPNKIEDSKYERNALLFNLCLVFKPEARTAPYRPLIHKLSDYLHSLETENGFLSDEESRKQLPLMMEQLYHDLNDTGRCVLKLKLRHPLHIAKELEQKALIEATAAEMGERRLSFSERRRWDSGPQGRGRVGVVGGVRPGGGGCGIGSVGSGGPASGETCGGRGCAMDRDTHQPEEIAVLYLKVVDACEAPVPVGEEQVPVLVKPDISEDQHLLDLTTQQILPYIDGVDHVAKIACLANVELDLAKKCVQNLVYYEIVQLLPIFQYSNVYVHNTEEMMQLYWSSVLQQKCLEYVVGDAAGEPLLFDQVFRLYAKFTRGRTVRQICYCELQLGVSFPPPPPSGVTAHTKPKLPPNVDIRRLVKFGLMHGIIRRIQQYPLYTPHFNKKHKRDRRSESQTSSSQSLRRFCDGTASYDLLCSKFCMTNKELHNRLAQDKEISILWK